MQSQYRIVALTVVCAAASALADPMGSAFTYQGQIKQNGSALNGFVDLTMTLWDAPTDGNQIVLSQSMSNVPVTNGLFTVQLDAAGEFGSSAFNGSARWLEIVLNGTTLSPRQPLTAAPAALFAAAPWALNGTSLSYIGGNVGIGLSGPLSPLQVLCSNFGAGIGKGIFLGGSANGNTGLALDLSAQNSGYATLQTVKAQGSAYGDIVLGPLGGKVGIGTTGAPGFPLSFPDVVGDKIALWGQSGSHYGFGIQNGVLQIHSDSATTDISFGYGSSGNFTETMRVKGNGQVLINSNGSSGAKLEVFSTGPGIQGTGSDGVTGIAASGPNRNGIHGIGNALGQKAGLFDGNVQVNGTLCASGAIGTCSDRRFKEHIEPLTGALQTVERLRGVQFDWKRGEFPERRFSEDRQIGFIAQEVEMVLPEVVQKASNGYLSVDYGRVTPILVEAVKELKQENRELKDRLARLEEAVNRLEEKKTPPTQSVSLNSHR